LASTGRTSNPLDRCKRFQIIHPPFLDLAWRKGSFILFYTIATATTTCIVYPSLTALRVHWGISRTV